MIAWCNDNGAGRGRGWEQLGWGWWRRRLSWQLQKLCAQKVDGSGFAVGPVAGGICPWGDVCHSQQCAVHAAEHWDRTDDRGTLPEWLRLVHGTKRHRIKCPWNNDMRQLVEELKSSSCTSACEIRQFLKTTDSTFGENYSWPWLNISSKSKGGKCQLSVVFKGEERKGAMSIVHRGNICFLVLMTWIWVFRWICILFLFFRFLVIYDQ